jgi:hypothetical protein
MRMRPDLFRPAVRRLTGGKAVTFGSSDPTNRRWLAKRKLPEVLTRFLLENAPSAETSFDCAGGMWTPKDVMELNDQEKAMPASGLFAVGNAINGDFIVIDFKNGGHVNLLFARQLLSLSPSEFECVIIDDRVYLRMWWNRTSAAYRRLTAVPK